MLEHLIAFGRLVFPKELIDDDCGICLFGQPGALRIAAGGGAWSGFEDGTEARPDVPRSGRSCPGKWSGGFHTDTVQREK